ncbi:hypothetical protein ABIC76_001457 [Ralstonia sp. 1138]
MLMSSAADCLGQSSLSAAERRFFLIIEKTPGRHAASTPATPQPRPHTPWHADCFPPRERNGGNACIRHYERQNKQPQVGYSFWYRQRAAGFRSRNPLSRTRRLQTPLRRLNPRRQSTPCHGIRTPCRPRRQGRPPRSPRTLPRERASLGAAIRPAPVPPPQAPGAQLTCVPSRCASSHCANAVAGGCPGRRMRGIQ